ncbi:hypothetical protein FQN60_003224 [Etheostoma spectabile]|uniref:Uncharacterized protein n=1 Tax=Etheostoma spectabile TaxID=54343 RepID=A0A5J5CLM0_9PERO|nr:hypothetical protein FQN60_003224 [Etheostoma spectabile]
MRKGMGAGLQLMKVNSRYKMEEGSRDSVEMKKVQRKAEREKTIHVGGLENKTEGWEDPGGLQSCWLLQWKYDDALIDRKLGVDPSNPCSIGHSHAFPKVVHEGHASQDAVLSIRTDSHHLAINGHGFDCFVSGTAGTFEFTGEP